MVDILWRGKIKFKDKYLYIFLGVWLSDSNIDLQSVVLGNDELKKSEIKML